VAKSTAAEVARRIDEVRPLLVECLSLREIRSATVKGTSWGASVSLSQLKRYLAKARAQIRQAASIDREQEIGAMRLRYERVIAKAAATGDLRSELAASKQLCELFGLEAPRRSEVAVAGAIDLGAARELITDLLAAELARQGGASDDQTDDAD
jgi:hypothetical protein